MRHIIACTECGVDFEKKTAGTVCPECLANPVVEEPVEPKKPIQKTVKKTQRWSK